MTLEEAVKEVRKIRSKCEDPEFSDLLGDILAVYDFVEDEEEGQEDASN